MLKAIALGTLAQSALLLSGLLVYWINFPPKFVGVLAGFGAGALIEAVAFDLVAEAQALDSLQFAVWMLVGAAILLIGDAIVDRRFGGGGAMGIVVGSMVDGVPESAIFGIQVATGFRSASVSSPRSSSPTSLRRSRPPPISRRRDGRWVDWWACGRSYSCSVASHRPRIPPRRHVLGRRRGSHGRARGRRAPRDADQLADAVRVRTRRAARRRRYRPRLLHPVDVLMADMPEPEQERPRLHRPRRLIEAFYSTEQLRAGAAAHPAHVRALGHVHGGPGGFHRRRGADRDDLGGPSSVRGSPPPPGLRGRVRRALRDRRDPNVFIPDQIGDKGFMALVSALLYLGAPFSIIRHLVLRRAIDRETVLGAIAAYLMMGMFFAFAYRALGAIQAGPFFGPRATGRSRRTCSSRSRRSPRPATATSSPQGTQDNPSPSWRCSSGSCSS